MLKRAFGLLLILILIGVGFAYARRDAFQMTLFERAVRTGMARDTLATLDPKALHVAFCGTGSPLPSRDRAGACTAVIANGRIFVFDMGEGAGETLALMGLPLGKIEGVWLTHLHSDHFEGLGPAMLQRWAGTSAPTPVLVSGPAGTAEVTAGLNQAYRIDSGYRIAHHGPAVVPQTGFGFAGEEIGAGVVYDRDGVRITAFAVDHAPVAPAFGYRVDFNGRSVTISGDTKMSGTLIRAAKGTDLLVHEVLSARMVEAMARGAERTGQPNRAWIMRDIKDYHATPEQAAAVAKAAGAKALALTHVVPAAPGFLDGLFLRPARHGFAAPVLLMRDGDLVSLDGKTAPEATGLLD
jgi:ribonuclease Z